jgi:hypothetical protein
LIIQTPNLRGLQGIWLGATDELQEETFIWENSKIELLFKNFVSGQPDNAGK